jgi:hypothetical protein
MAARLTLTNTLPTGPHMGLFSSTKNTPTPETLATAIHELGHALVFKHGGLDITSITASEGRGMVVSRFRIEDPRWEALAIGSWAGFEAEDRWRRHNNLGRAHMDSSALDFQGFHDAVKHIPGGLSENSARKQARKLVNTYWREINRLAPILAKKGRIKL